MLVAYQPSGGNAFANLRALYTSHDSLVNVLSSNYNNLYRENRELFDQLLAGSFDAAYGEFKAWIETHPRPLVFKLGAALLGLELLTNTDRNANLPHHRISPVDSYGQYKPINDGSLPDARGLFTLLYGLINHKHEETLARLSTEDGVVEFISSYIAENWASLTASGGILAPYTTTDAGLFIEANRQFINSIAAVLNNNTEKLGKIDGLDNKQVLKLVGKIGKSLGAKRAIDFTPIVEALSTAMQGHNTDGFDQGQIKPACADGMYLNLLQEVAVVTGNASDMHLELRRCDVIE